MVEKKSKRKQTYFEEETREITSKVVWLVVLGSLTFLSSSFASRHYVDVRIQEKQAPMKAQINNLKTQFQEMNLSLKGIKKDTCYTRRAIAKMADESPLPNCLEE